MSWKCVRQELCESLRKFLAQESYKYASLHEFLTKRHKRILQGCLTTHFNAQPTKIEQNVIIQSFDSRERLGVLVDDYENLTMNSWLSSYKASHHCKYACESPAHVNGVKRRKQTIAKAECSKRDYRVTANENGSHSLQRASDSRAYQRLARWRLDLSEMWCGGR